MIRSFKGEVWKDMHKATWRSNEIFKVSSHGRVVRFKYDENGELLTPYVLGGYEVFSVMRKTGKSQLLYVHRCVADCFIDNPEEKPYVIHLDFDKSNNHVENLQYVTRKELTAHNLNNPAVIESKERTKNNPRYSKLTPGRVRLIKRKIFDPNRKTRMRMIAKQFGISGMQLYRIKSGENWGHITDY